MGLGPVGWLEVAAAKSGQPFAWAAWAGALVAGVEETDLQSMWDFGFHLGILRQVTDDIQDFWNEDWQEMLAHPHSSLPVCYTAWVLHGQEKANFIQLLEQGDLEYCDKAAQIRRMADGNGARQFTCAVSRMQEDLAENALQKTTRPGWSTQSLRNLLKVMMPCLPPLEHPKASPLE